MTILRERTRETQGPVTVDEHALVEKLREQELRSIKNDVDTDLREQILKALDERGRAQELIRQQYTGRYPFELLQNANDASADRETGGRVLFAVTEQALVVADEGMGFGPEQIKAICRLGRSSKDPRKTIGYKGLGFKSVGEITDQPQILSSGLAFGFDASRTRIAVENLAGALDPTQRLPVYAFPFILSREDFGPDASLVEDLTEQGFNTVLRLPFREDVARETVEEHIRQTIAPRLLLFLDATNSIELRGTNSDFDATAVRETVGACTDMLLQSGNEVEHWLVLRRALRDLDRALVDPLGDAWKLVEQVHVAVAVPLDGHGLPSHRRAEALHVYFPTDEPTGLSLVLQGDFALDLDRRHVAHAPEMLPYNEWLASQLADLVAEVAESLAIRFPGHASVVAALAPAGQASGFGLNIFDGCLLRLRSAPFVPVVGGEMSAPRDAVLLPATLPRPGLAHRFLSLEDHPSVVLADVEAHQPSRHLLAELLDTPHLTTAVSLSLVNQPEPSDDSIFYEFLVEWAEEEGRRFASQLEDTPCVRTLGGGWVAPSANVFFPRQREEVEFPEGLRVPIIAVPEVEGLRPLLEAAGVRAFEWRQLIPEFVIPLLTDPTVDEQTRQAAFVALRGYYDTERTGDPRMRLQISQVLLPSAKASGSDRSMQPAGSLYFSQAWLGHDRLERIYGPFDKVEFLAVDPPPVREERQADRAFYEWMGVAPHPRIDERRADQRDQYPIGNLYRHPHRSYSKLWDGWQAEEVRNSAVCDQGHSTAQQLRSSFALDRFPELAATRDPDRLALLWKELCVGWPRYARALTAEIQCQHGWHSGGDTVRSVPSLLQHMLRRLAWVPCVRRHERTVVPPDHAWRITADTPPRIVERVAVLDPALDVSGSAQVVAALNVVDAARPAPANLAALLRDLEEGFGDATDDDGRSVQLAARWAMRTLNDVLDTELLEEPVPLLARLDGRHVFSDKPLVATDPLLAETWEPVFPILDADRDLRRLHDALQLRILDEEVITRPDPRGARPDRRLAVETQIDDAKPYLAAVAIDQVPSRHSDILRGLARLEVSVCVELVLRYELDGETRERDEAVSYIAARIEQEGIIRRRIGTAHLELDPVTQAPHWYALGPQLAQFLGVPNQGDAFALLLSATKSDRQQYLAARRISLTSVDEARLELAQTPSDEVIQDLLHLGDDLSAAEEAAEPSEAETSRESLSTHGPSDEPESVETHVELPELDHDAISMTDAAEPAGREREDADRPRRRPGLGPLGPVDHERQQRVQRRIGRRGEEAAYEAERRRLIALGRDPALVVWRSRERELAPYDIESLDEDGQQIYIEVKSTTSDDPCDPFEISEAELLFALQKRSHYYIYRVTDAHTARPPITRFRDPIERLHHNTARLRLSGARITFLPDDSEATIDEPSSDPSQPFDERETRT